MAELEQSLRADFRAIAKFIPENAKILDIGCGEGELLEFLVHHKHVDGRGMELSSNNVSKCVQRGLMCIQGDADEDLKYYPDNCFDYIISTNTIKATKNPKTVLSEMLRISRYVVVSVPNFGYWLNRWYLFRNGRMPVTEALSYQWYETPNIHFCTMKDFVVLCKELDCVVERQIFISSTGSALLFPNWFAEQGVFLLHKR
jgi:methionine biosynthesis protein MetW